MDPIVTGQKIEAFARVARAILKFTGRQIGRLHSEIDALIQNLAKSVRSLYDMVVTLDSIKTVEQFSGHFDSVHAHLRKIYFGRNNIAKARTRCADLRRSTLRIQTRIDVLLLSPIGGFQEMTRELEKITSRDEEFEAAYRMTVKYIQSEMDAIAARRESDLKAAFTRYKRLRNFLARRLRGLDQAVESMEDAQNKFRRNVGS